MPPSAIRPSWYPPRRTPLLHFNRSPWYPTPQLFGELGSSAGLASSHHVDGWSLIRTVMGATATAERTAGGSTPELATADTAAQGQGRGCRNRWLCVGVHAARRGSTPTHCPALHWQPQAPHTHTPAVPNHLWMVPLALHLHTGGARSSVRLRARPDGVRRVAAAPSYTPSGKTRHRAIHMAACARGGGRCVHRPMHPTPPRVRDEHAIAIRRARGRLSRRRTRGVRTRMVMVVEQPARRAACLDARGSGVPVRWARCGAALAADREPPKGRRREAAIGEQSQNLPLMSSTHAQHSCPLASGVCALCISPLRIWCNLKPRWSPRARSWQFPHT